MKNNKNVLYVIITFFCILLIIGISYALYIYSATGNENKINTGTINFNYIENDTALNIQNPNPVSDNDAKVSNDYFEFTVSSSATGIIDVGYYIYLTTSNENSASLNNYVKIYLTKVNDDIETEVVTPTLISSLIPFDVGSLTYNSTSLNRLIYSSYYAFNNDSTLQSTIYRFRMWVDSSYFDSSYNITENEGTHEISTTQASFKITISVKGVNGKPITIA